MADFTPILQQAEQKFNLPPGILQAMMGQESGGDPNAVSKKGAVGLLQLEPGTAKDMGVKDIKDPVQNIFGGARYLRQNMDTFGSLPLALAAYNAGPGAIQANGGSIPLNGETPEYVSTIMDNYQGMPQADMQPQQIDPGSVKWDDDPSGGQPTASAIDPNAVKWDDDTQLAKQSAKAPTPHPALPRTPQQKLVDALTNGPLDQLTQGMLHGVTNTVGGAVQHAAHGLGWVADKFGMSDTDAALSNAGDKVAAFLQQGTPNTPLGMAGQMIGGAALPGGAGVEGAAPSLLRTAAQGAALGAAQPVQPGQNFGQTTLQNAGVGGALGAAGNVASRVIGGAATPEARALMNQGVDVTPGQGMGGVARTLEEQAKSIPLVGNAISSAERSNVRSYNTMLYQDALAPIGATLPRGTAVGSDGVAAVRSAIGDEFNNLAANATFTPRGQFLRDAANIRADLAQRAPSTLDQFNNILDNQIGAKLRPTAAAPNGQMTGSQWNDSRSFISGISRDNRLGNTTPDQRALADAADDLNEAMNQQVARESNDPQFTQRLQNANNAYARYKRVETAAGSGGASNNDNVFSPAQYAAAVRQGSTKFQRATNSGLNANTAANAQQVLGSKYPDSGTPGRLMFGAAALGLGAHVNPVAAAGIGGGSLLYATPAGRRAMQALLFSRPELLQQLGGAGAGLATGAGVLAPQIQPQQQSQ